MNRVVLAGRITRDPELRTSSSGVSFTSFSIAVNRVVPNNQGERTADFINCVAFGKQAENLTRFIKKGGLIGVDGRLQTNSYQAQDGSNRTRTDVVCENITFLESKNSQNQGSNQGYDYNNYQDNYSQQAQQYNQKNYSQQNTQASYGEMPFQRSSNQQPQQQFNQQRNNVASQPMPAQDNKQNEEKDSFADVEKQFDISDDDLPF